MVITRERKSFMIILGLIGMFLFISYAQAQQPQAKQPQSKQLEAQYLDERIANQTKRIDQKIQGGHITKDEKRILLDNVNYVKEQEAHYKASGVFTMQQRQQLHGLLDQNSSMIEKQKPVKTLRSGGVESHGIVAAGKEALSKAATTAGPAKSVSEAGKEALAKAATTAVPAKPVSETQPAKEMKVEKAAEPSALAAKLPAGKKININAASKEELGALPGIGPAKAQAIIDGRPYKKTEDIMKVKGIKKGEFDKIKDLITVQ